MEKVCIYHGVGEPFYCPFCGTKTIPEYVEGQEEEFDFNICKHVIYIGTTDSDLYYVNEKYEKEINKTIEKEGEFEEEVLTKCKIDDAIHFSLCDFPPSAFGVYVCYKE
jgi:hypothetical protein